MRMSIHMMVLNGAKVIERALRPFATIADEVELVDTGSIDGTPEFVKHLCSTKFPGEFGEKSRLRCQVAALIRPETHPEMYFRDRPSSWAMEMPEPFTGQPMLADWAAARNMGVCRCQGEYILKLDADDEVLDPGNILPVLKFLDDHPSIDFLYCPYEICDYAGDNTESYDTKNPALETISMYDRIWRNRPHRLQKCLPGCKTAGGRRSPRRPNRDARTSARSAGATRPCRPPTDNRIGSRTTAA